MSTFPAIATCLLGVSAGRWFRSDRPSVETALGMYVWGVFAMLAGVIWGIWFPINKNLWSSSYVLFTAGFALMLLATLYYFIDIRGRDRWARPLYVFGTNSILAFVASGLFARILLLWKVGAADRSTVTLYTWLYQHGFASWAGPLNGSLAFAVAYVLLFLAAMTVLYQKRWFVKI
jgi:predicted acyltransferase